MYLLSSCRRKKFIDCFTILLGKNFIAKLSLKALERKTRSQKTSFWHFIVHHKMNKQFFIRPRFSNFSVKWQKRLPSITTLLGEKFKRFPEPLIFIKLIMGAFPRIHKLFYWSINCFLITSTHNIRRNMNMEKGSPAWPWKTPQNFMSSFDGKKCMNNLTKR